MTAIAVLMALYGRDDPVLFERALKSVLEQHIPANHRMRVYLGVDGPLPKSLEAVLERYMDKFFKVSRSDNNLGLAQTLNRLITERSNETFFFRMDADDLCLPGRFESQLRYLTEHSDIDILGTAILEDDGKTPPRLVRFAKGPEDARKGIAKRVPIAHPTACIRARVFDIVKQYPERNGNEDIAMWIECLLAGFRFDNLAEPYLQFTVASGFWKRRSIDKAFSECACYLQGIWRLDHFTWRYVFPLARLFVRLCPTWLTQRLYASKLLRR